MRWSRRLLETECTLALLLFMFCTTAPVETAEEEATVLRLSLEEPGRKTAEFSGAPIEAIIDLDRDTFFTELHWNTGQGSPLYAEGLIGEKAKRFSVPLYWTRYPLHRDSVDSCFYDTVWASMGGGLKKSNKVRVKVTNLPVVMDSARFDSNLFIGLDTVWQCSLPVVPDTSYQLVVYARDLDKKPPEIQFLGARGRIIQASATAQEVEYRPPAGDFIDTIHIVAFDQVRGQVFRTLILHHTTPNRLPVVDSIQIGTIMLGPSSFSGGFYRAGFPAMDTLRLRLFAHDSLGTVVRAAWRAALNELTADSATTFRATYVCGEEMCGDTVADTSIAIDTITVTVYDNRGDSTVRRIQLSRGKLNEAPRIQRFEVDGSAVSFIESAATVRLTGGSDHTFTLEAADPELGNITVSWTASPASRLSAQTDSSARYTAPAELDTDTVTVTVSDGALMVSRSLRIIIDDVIPVLDSITGNDTVFRGVDSLHITTVQPRDTLLFVAYATDRDAADSLGYLWTSGKPQRFSIRLGNRARYILPDTALNDTIILTLQDGNAQVVGKIVLKPANRAPVIDTLLSDEIRLVPNGALFRDTALAGDTVNFRVAAHDPDGDTFAIAWSTQDSTRLSSTGGDRIDYFCAETAYNDTVSFSIGDADGAGLTRKIILTVDTTTVP